MVQERCLAARDVALRMRACCIEGALRCLACAEVVFGSILAQVILRACPNVFFDAVSAQVIFRVLKWARPSKVLLYFARPGACFLLHFRLSFLLRFRLSSLLHFRLSFLFHFRD